jgi:hypothetical protein
MENKSITVSLPKWAVKGLKKYFEVNTPELAAKLAIDEVVILLQEYRPNVFK